ncbi:MAG TPA: TIGR03619 family F420-dependent LLM class oxidoreductase [Acidimicrobiales bacterium]|nr:TIGR03619 family F420-dependent LLM class oxidoreductase [Acidimicrobiales bacterium]
MEIGVRIPHTGAHASPELVRQWCGRAEAAGFGSLWGVDHVVMPRRVASLYPLGRSPAAIRDGAVSGLLSPNFELMTTLAFVAAVTERIRIVSGIGVLTIRNAVLNARQLATVDRYSGGRLVYGVGVGWLAEEARAMGMPWDRRGARADEHIALLRAIWTAPGPHVEFHGEFWDVPAMDPEPRPVQRPIPILVGGHSAAAIDRAARLGDGWIAGKLSPVRLSEALPQLRAAAERHGRDPATLLVYCSAGRSDLGLDECRRYEELGVHCLQVGMPSLDDLQRFGDRVLPRLAR